MGVTGIVLFIVFLLVKSLLDKKKKEARREKAPAAPAAPAAMGGTPDAVQGIAENPAEVQDLLRRLFDERMTQMEVAHTPQTAAALPAAPLPQTKRREEPRGAQEEAAQDGAFALDFAPAAMLQAVMLAEVIGRPKAQRKRSPYFRS